MAGPPKSPARSKAPTTTTTQATRCILPSAAATVTPATASTTRSAISTDPNLLLDAFDEFTAANRRSSTSMTTGPSTKSKAPPLATSTTKTTVSATTSNNNNNNNSTEHGPNPIEFLNKHFTNEALLVAQLPFIRDAVTERMDRLDDRISTALQRQSETAPATQKHVQDAKASVASLEQRIRQVQQKASQSEKTVREITKDMKRLDCAKRHLQRTITTLKRLHMLIHAVEQLRLACLAKPFANYKEAAHLVDAIRFLLKHFDAYKQKVQPMYQLSQKVTDLHGELKYCLIHAFRVVGFGIDATIEMEKDKKNKYRSLQIPNGEEQQDTVVMPPSVMADGILMIDALGGDARDEFITVFGQDHLAEYSKHYKPVKKQPPAPKVEKRVSSFKAQPEPATPVNNNNNGPDAKPDFALECIEKRFLWFRRMLDNIAEKYPAVFPNYWNIEYLLTKTFLKRTRGHILALLHGPTKDPDSNNATVLLKALQKTIQFEKEVSGALQREYGTIFKEPAKVADTTAASAGTTPKGNSKSQQEPQTKKAPPTSATSSGTSDDGRASTEQASVDPLFGVASSAFDNYMGPYIALEEQSMDEQLVVALEDRAVDTRGELPVFTTSTKLFIYIKSSVTRCTALTKGNAFFLLYQAFQDSLRKYAQVLSSKLPPPLPQKTGGLNLPNVNFNRQEGNQAQSNATASYKVPPGEEVTASYVIGTCEYCAETVEALEDLIRDTVDDQYKERIDMMPQQEAFHDIAAKATQVLVSGLENRLEDAFKMMTSTNWAMFDEVGEESDYVRYMHREIQPYITTIRGLIPTSYFRSICDKFANAFGNAYYDAIIRVKTINEPGSQQLLLDVSILKSLFLKLPVMEAAANTGSAALTSPRKAVQAGKTTIAPVVYTKMVQKQFKKIEILLKLTGTPVSLLIDVFREQWPGGSVQDLQTIMSLKGLKRIEQITILEKFGLDPVTARKGATMNVTSATIVSERLQVVQGQAARVNNDFKQMRQKVDDFRRAFR